MNTRSPCVHTGRTNLAWNKLPVVVLLEESAAHIGNNTTGSWKRSAISAGIMRLFR